MSGKKIKRVQAFKNLRHIVFRDGTEQFWAGAFGYERRTNGSVAPLMAEIS